MRIPKLNVLFWCGILSSYKYASYLPCICYMVMLLFYSASSIFFQNRGTKVFAPLLDKRHSALHTTFEVKISSQANLYSWLILHKYNLIGLQMSVFGSSGICLPSILLRWKFLIWSQRTYRILRWGGMYLALYVDNAFTMISSGNLFIYSQFPCSIFYIDFVCKHMNECHAECALFLYTKYSSIKLSHYSLCVAGVS